MSSSYSVFLFLRSYKSRRYTVILFCCFWHVLWSSFNYDTSFCRWLYFLILSSSSYFLFRSSVFSLSYLAFISFTICLFFLSLSSFLFSCLYISNLQVFSCSFNLFMVYSLSSRSEANPLYLLTKLCRSILSFSNLSISSFLLWTKLFSLWIYWLNKIILFS